MTQHDVVVVHGVRNWLPGVPSTDAADVLAKKWAGPLVDGYRSAGLGHVAPPRIHAAYYADLLNDVEAQAVVDDVDDLSPDEQALLLAWLRAAGLPEDPPEGQAWGTMPVRQALAWYAQRRSASAERTARVAVALLPEVYGYLASPARRKSARRVVADAVEASGTKVVIAHSLGSVVAYEALHDPALPQVELLVTVGSPLGLPGGVFEMLDPAPTGGRGSRPPGLARWVNIADPGDLVAVPRRLGDRFDVDGHYEEHIATVDFHTLDNYLSCGLVATAVVPYLS